MRSRHIVTCLVMLVCGVRLCSAQSQRLPFPAGNLKIMGFMLAESTLADVQAKLGKSDIKRCSRDDVASYEMCYVSAGKDQTKVVFKSGPMGGWSELDSYQVIAGGLDRPCYRRCSRTTQVTSQVKTEGGLKLGLSREQLIAMLGKPLSQKQVIANLGESPQFAKNKLYFLWTSRLAMTKEPDEDASYWHVQDTIIVTLKNSTVVEFEVIHLVMD